MWVRFRPSWDRFIRFIENQHYSDNDILFIFNFFLFLLQNNAMISYADAVLLVFSVTDKSSFENAKLLVDKVRSLNVNNIPILVVANKIDQCKKRTVSKDDIERWSVLNLPFLKLVRSSKSFISICFNEQGSLPSVKSRTRYCLC